VLPLMEIGMSAAPIDRRDFLRRSAVLGTALPFAGFGRAAAAAEPNSSPVGYFSTIPTTAACE